jgi:uncharacterized protein YkwD
MKNFPIKISICFIFLSAFFSDKIFAQQTTSKIEIEQEIFNEINVARKNPQQYIGYLEDYKKLLNGNIVQYPNGSSLRTNEGAVAVDDAINYLKSLPKLEPYKFSKALTIPAQAQLKDLSENPNLGHFGKDGSNLPTRLAKYGIVIYPYAENITYYADSPRNIVMLMIVDDGNKGRGHRKNLFSQTLRQVGIAAGLGSKKEVLTVTIFANNYREINNKSGVRQL